MTDEDLVYGIASVLGYDTVHLWKKRHNSDSRTFEPYHTWNISSLFALSENNLFRGKLKYYPYFTCRAVVLTVPMWV